MIRAYGLAAALICYARDAAACLRSLAGNGRPDSLDAASVPRDPEPAAWCDSCACWNGHAHPSCPGAGPMPPPWANDPRPLADAAMDFLRRSLAELEAVETVADLLYAAGEDVQ